MRLTWHSFDLKTGRRGAEVQVQALGKLKRIIGESTETVLSVRCYDARLETSPFGLPTEAGVITGWDEATLPGRTMLVALDENEHIWWGGMVLRRISAAGEWVQLSVHTLEHYFNRRYVGDLAYIDADVATIAAGVIDEQDVDGLDLVIDAPLTGHRLEEAIYGADEDKTIASIMETLGGVTGGVEYTIELSWADSDRTRLTRTVRIRQRLGTVRDLTPMWVMPGPVTGFQYVEGYGVDEGANDVLATSSGEGSERPSSSHHVATDLIAGGWAKFERRFTPGASITDDTELDQHAETELQEKKHGLTQLSIVARLGAAPRLGIDWWLGDDITASLTCPRFPARVGPDGDRVAGYTQRLRTVGVEIDVDQLTLTPITRETEEG